MKRLIFTFLFVFLVGFSTAVAQDITADQIRSDFAKWLPNMNADDSKLQEREASQQGWQKYCMYVGAPGREDLKKVVNSLAVEQLDKDIPVVTKVWLLHQLAWTAGASEVGAIAKLLDDGQMKIRDEAARTLANIPGPEAEKALKDATKTGDQKRIDDAIADRVPVPAKFADETVMPFAIPYSSEQDIAKWMDGYDKMDDYLKAQTIAALTVKKDKKYFPKMLDALKSSDALLKRTALLAMEKLASKDNIPAILEIGEPFDRGLTIRILSTLAADGTDDYFLDELKKATDTNKIMLYSEILSKRYCKKALPVILGFAKKNDFPNRQALLEWLEGNKLADKENIGDFLEVTLMITDRQTRDRAEQSIARICNGDAKPVIEKMNSSNEIEILTLLGRIGGKDALDAVNKMIESKDTNVHNAAVRALCNWPNATVSKELLALAENKDEAAPNRVAALRAYVRVITLPDNQIGIRINGRQKLEMLKNAMTIATRNEEKALALDRLASVRENATVEYALGFVDDSALSAAAFRTILEIAHQDYMRKGNPELFTKALDTVIEKSKDRAQVERAKRYLEQMQ